MKKNQLKEWEEIHLDIFRNILRYEEIFVGGEGGKDSCQGDSGGPLAVWVSSHFYLLNT